MAYIKCDDLTLGYDGIPVTEHVSFEVNKGDYLCIVGENGVGKSTLVKTLLNLIKPLAGTIETGDDLKQGEIGYLPQQNSMQKDFPANVREIVLSGTLNTEKFRPFYSKAQKELADESMRKMGIEDFKKKSFRQLSGGQQQRVLLARALCATGKIILLDEPVAGLDPKVTIELYDLIKELNESGIAIIMVTHDIRAAVSYASHILHLGRDEMFFGTVEEYNTSKAGAVFSTCDDEIKQ
ncbi:MAG: metal ABC transporter ATP-binding protein [Lachnospiraceae bacterium]